MTENPVHFGTDGWRAILADSFTFENVRACARAVADHFAAAGPNRRFVVGHDTRFMSEDFALAAAEVVAAAGFAVELADRPAPTPAISHRVVSAEAAGAIVVTSSHNPRNWNGIKVKESFGGSAGETATAAIEARVQGYLDQPGSVASSHAPAGTIERFNPFDGYLEKLSTLVDIRRIRAAGLRVTIDPMYGTAAGIYAELIGSGKTVISEIHGERNPLFPGLRAPEPIEENLDELMLLLANGSHHAGIANDGDADRLGLVDEHGNYVDQLRTFALLTEYLLGEKGERGPVVKSLTTTSMALRLAEHYGVPSFETQVGFKHLGPVFRREDALIAGEESGGYAFRGHVPERDGVLAGLMVLEFMAATGKPLSALVERVFAITGPHYYRRRDFVLPTSQREPVRAALDAAAPESIGGLPVTGRDTIDGWRFHFENGWLLYRLSGTEPLLRIYTELGDQAQVAHVLDAAEALVGVGPSAPAA